jgi:hypothetical protein
MFSAMPDHFGCDACASLQPLDLLCHTPAPCRDTGTHTQRTLLCLRCCHCETHRLDADPGGRVVWTQQHGWRGLHDSLWRTRRHQ